MNILLIKQTSLGDVLHSTPHIRAIKAQYPDAHLTVVTASGSAEILDEHPDIDRLILFDYAKFRQLGLKAPRASLALIREVLVQINAREYDLAFDLQGLLRSVIFLYLAKAKRKFVKGRWIGLGGFRNKQLHAIEEMSEVLAQADIDVPDQSMEFHRASNTTVALRAALSAHDLTAIIDHEGSVPTVVMSPFTRWPSKNWALDNFIQTAQKMSEIVTVVITGVEQDRALIEDALIRLAGGSKNVHCLAGELSLSELAELMSHAGLVISGDSFPMHLAAAVDTPLIALFGPTDERKTGPLSSQAEVLRPQRCDRCDKPSCPRACLDQIGIEEVVRLATAKIQQN